MQEFPIRRTNRLKNYDYNQIGGYFISICSKDKQKIFGSVVGDGVLDVPTCELSEIGKIVNICIDNIKNLYTDVCIEKYVIMPNHIHMIIQVTNSNGSSRTPTPTNASIPRLISTFKRYTNKECGVSLWQRSYYDHIIRNEEDHVRIWEYIDNNPARWTEDRYYQ